MIIIGLATLPSIERVGGVVPIAGRHQKKALLYHPFFYLFPDNSPNITNPINPKNPDSDLIPDRLATLQNTLNSFQCFSLSA
jgi:hypothetical protein